MKPTPAECPRRPWLADLTMVVAVVTCLAGALALVNECAYRIVLGDGTPNLWAADEELNALVEAAAEGRVDRVASLLRGGAAVNGRDYTEFTPLMRAAAFGHADVCRLLLDRGADIEAFSGQGWNALMLAVGGCHEPVIRLLLQRGAAVDAPVPGGRTALMCACAAADDRTCAILVEAGADVNAAADNGVTPLIEAAARPGAEGGTVVIRLLIDHGARVNVADRTGSTPLIEATRWGAPQDVALLLSSGADPTLRDGDGLDAVAHAARNLDRADVATLLRDATGAAGVASNAARSADAHGTMRRNP